MTITLIGLFRFIDGGEALFASLRLQPNYLAFQALQMKGNFASLLTVRLGTVTCQLNNCNKETCIQASFPTKTFQTTFNCYLFTLVNHSFCTNMPLELHWNKHPLFRFNIIVRLMTILSSDQKERKRTFYAKYCLNTFLALALTLRKREVGKWGVRRITLLKWEFCMNHIRRSGCGPTAQTPSVPIVR